MQSKDKIISYKGVNIYAGIDVHAKSWNVTILVEGTFYRTISMEPDAVKLLFFLEREFPEGSYYSAYEAGFCGFSVHRKLEEYGIKNIVVNAADIPTTDKDKRQKEDKRDSRKIARSLRNGDLIGIHVPELELEELRGLVRYRKTISKEVTRCKNRIKSYLKVNGIESPEALQQTSGWSSKYIKWLETLRLSTPYGNMVMDENIEMIKYLRKKDLKVLKELRQIGLSEKYKWKIILLRSVPGIGAIVSITLLTELGDIRRFKTLDRLSSYVGLIPSTNSSGEKERTGRITRRSNKILRSVLIESSWVAIRHDSAMLLSYNKLIKRMNANEAIVRIAKKLLSRIRYVLLNKEMYVKSTI